MGPLNALLPSPNQIKLSQYAQRRIARDWHSVTKIIRMRPVAFGAAVPAGTRLILFSDDRPDRFFTIVKFWMDATSSVALELKTGVPTYPSQRGGRQNSFTASLAKRGRE
jgi:hypothetical protein